MKNDKKNSYKAIIIANGGEAFSGVLNKIEDKKEKKRKIMLEHYLSERAMFWECDDKVVITPYLINNSLINKNAELFNFNNLKNLAPSTINISLSKAIINDRSLWNAIVKIIKDNPGINVSSYAVTEDFMLLIRGFKKRNLKFTSNEKPEQESEWTVSYLDSKVGFRLEMNKIQSSLKESIVPEGFICRDKKEAMNIAKWFYKKKRSCVVKVNYGESGWGTVILKIEDFGSIEVLEKGLEREFNSDLIWDKTLIVVEEFIKPNKNIGGGSPSTEVYVDDYGPKLTYSCGQLLVNQKEFIGVAMGNKYFNDDINSKFKNIGLAVGKRYWELGYRGFFDIDFVISSQGKPYAIETNNRRTGGTHVFDIARNLLGRKRGKKFYLISRDSFKYGNKNLSSKISIDKMSYIMYPIKNNKKGIVVTIIDECLPVFGFVIIANDAKEANQIYRKLFNVWHK